MSGVLRIGNCSGFYGDRLSAMHEMLTGGELDVLTGDYLAELTMLILGRDQMRDPTRGYARTFLRQAEACMGLALDRGVRLVSNAGGLNPAGLADRLREVATGLGLSPRIAHTEGDNVLDRAEALGIPGRPLTANVYLGGFGIAEALAAGADIVVTGRVTDASLVVGPAVAHFGWDATSYDELAGAVVAGHVLECGTQATGGNFSGFRALGVDTRPLGFPLVELTADGSSVVTKHDATGGAVTLDTVTAQLVYEVQSERYLGPDVTTHLDTVRLEEDGPDRVRIAGVRGSAPPSTLKVCVNEPGGFRNAAELVLTGLDIDAKADWVRAQIEATLAADPPESVEWSLARTDHDDAVTEEGASCRLRVSVRDPEPDRVGKAFTAPLVELALGSYPGFTMTAPPAPATPYGIYRAAYVDRDAVAEKVVLHFAVARSTAPDPAADNGAASGRRGSDASKRRPSTPRSGAVGSDPGAARRVPLGTIVHARSGDKGGDANIGLWAMDAATRPDRVAWLLELVTVDRVKALVPEAEELDVEVFALPNLGAVNVVVHGLLGDGVAASTRFDPQAKGLGEWVRSRHVDIPEALL